MGLTIDTSKKSLGQLVKEGYLVPGGKEKKAAPPGLSLGELVKQGYLVPGGKAATNQDIARKNPRLPEPGVGGRLHGKPTAGPGKAPPTSRPPVKEVRLLEPGVGARLRGKLTTRPTAAKPGERIGRPAPGPRQPLKPTPPGKLKPGLSARRGRIRKPTPGRIVHYSEGGVVTGQGSGPQKSQASSNLAKGFGGK